MGTMSDATKATLTVKIGGREYTLSPLELNDWGDAEKWMEMLPYDRARRKIATLGELATPERQEKILAEAEAESESLKFGTEEFQAKVLTIEGQGFMIWKSLSRHHPELTHEGALSLLTVDSLDEWQAALNRVSSTTKEGEDDTRPTEISQPE